MKAWRFIWAWCLVTFLLLVSVVIVDTLFLLWRSRQGETGSSGLWTPQVLIVGFISDLLRALLLCYLFPRLKRAGQSVAEAIRFGLVINTIMATLWLLVGYFDLKINDPLLFVIYDGIIFVVQGVLSGFGLHLACRRGWLSVL